MRADPVALRTVLVTGGAGFIGSNFVRHTLQVDADIQLVTLDLLTYAGMRQNLENLPNPKRHRLVHGDIRDAALVTSLMDGSHPALAGLPKIDGVAHFAAESHVDRSIHGPEAFVSTNVQGTLVLLEAARRVWQDRDHVRFLHVSTDEVYGSLGAEGLFTEQTAIAPNSPYAASKASSDLLVRAYVNTYGFPALITRCSNNYGPYQLPEKLIPVVIERLLARQPVPVYGDGKNVRDWLYVTDHVVALQRVLAAGIPGEVYNIGGHNEWDNLSLVERLCDLVDDRTGRSDCRGLISFVTDRLGHDRRYAIDAGKIDRALGWRPAETFDTGIERTVDWYLGQRDWVACAQAQLQ